MTTRNTHQKDSIMAHTISDAQISGMIAAMDSSAEREVPPEFGCKFDLREAWLEGYNSLATSMLNQRPGVMEAPTTTERKPRVKHVKATAAAPKITARPTMMAILDQQLAEQF